MSSLLLTIPERSNADFSSALHNSLMRHQNSQQQKKMQQNKKNQSKTLSAGSYIHIFSLALTFMLQIMGKWTIFLLTKIPEAFANFIRHVNWDAHFDLESKSEFGRDHLCRSLNKTPQCLHTHQSLISFVHCSYSLSLSNWNSALEKWNLGDMEGSDVSVLVLFSIIKPEISVSFLFAVLLKTVCCFLWKLPKLTMWLPTTWL